MSTIPSHTPMLAIGSSGSTVGNVTGAEGADNLAALIVDEFGVIRGCNRAGELAFGYCSGEMIQQHVSLLLPQLRNLELMQDGRPNSRLRFLCRTGHQYWAVSANGSRFACKLFFNLLDNRAFTRLSLIVRPVGKQTIGHKSETLNG